MNSIRTKVTAIIALALAVAGILFIFYAVSAEREARRHNLSHIKSVLLYESEKIDRTINQLENNAFSLAQQGQLLLRQSKWQLESLRPNLKNNLERCPAALGGGLWMLATPSHSHGHGIYACRNEHGDIVTPQYWPAERGNFRRQLWFEQLKNQFTSNDPVAWSSAYTDQWGSKAAMATVGAAIYTSDGTLAGLATIDWRLQSLISYLNSLKLTANTFVLLFDNHKHQVVAELRGQSCAFFDRCTVANPSADWLHRLPVADRSKVSQKKLAIQGKVHYSFGRRLSNNMVVWVQIPRSEINEMFKYRDLVLLYCGLMLVILLPGTALYFLTKWVNRPLTRLMENVEKLGHGELDTQFELGRNDEISQLGNAFNQMTQSLKKHIANLKKITAEQERLNHELQVAQQIQNSILPAWEAPFPTNEHFSLDAFLVPARQVGGDLYDFFMLDDHRVALVIGDVSDKGIAPALFMAVTQTMHRGLAAAPDLTPARLVTRLNRALCSNNNAGLFVTYTFAVVDLHTAVLTYCNAGHNPFLVVGHATGLLTTAHRHGIPLGINPEGEYREETLQLHRGDTLFFYTDGVTEAQNRNGEFFSSKKLELFIQECVSQASIPSVINARLRRHLINFVDGAAQSDDITVLTFRLGAPE